MPAKNQTITVSQSTDKRVTVKVTGTDPTQAAAIRWTAFDTNGSVIIVKNLIWDDDEVDDTSGIGGLTAPTGGEPGTFDVYLFASDTGIAAATYKHEARVKDGDSQQDVVEQGNLVVEPSYTTPI